MANRKDDPDDYEVLSKIWVIACNDEIPAVLYQGLYHRLNLPAHYDLRGLIRHNGELFRLGIPSEWCKEWKTAMLADRRLPPWLQKVPSQERSAFLESFSEEDGFRSQFRVKMDAPRSDTDTLELGRSHIERLRKAHAEAREMTAKNRVMWLTFATSLLGVVATIVAALLRK